VNQSWYDLSIDSDEVKLQKKNIIFFYAGSSPIHPVDFLYEAVAHNSLCVYNGMLGVQDYKNDVF
jgi:hypothetical protein